MTEDKEREAIKRAIETGECFWVLSGWKNKLNLQ